MVELSISSIPWQNFPDECQPRNTDRNIGKRLTKQKAFTSSSRDENITGLAPKRNRQVNAKHFFVNRDEHSLPRYTALNVAEAQLWKVNVVLWALVHTLLERPWQAPSPTILQRHRCSFLTLSTENRTHTCEEPIIRLTISHDHLTLCKTGSCWASTQRFEVIRNLW